ncbi:uncharacterized protein LOC132904245 [Amyelois transitella]|uniref:uncharacterized protein LOC132904245 n=1 Tax=Amyelois transitella TaxID=680683 RepID=UPI00299081C8|nr:uncharacterized protein LOC132904245 [Amyelois transitella]
MAPDNSNESVISVIHNCQSKHAKNLCIYDFMYKVIHNNHYDLGGSYTGPESDLWFYITSSTFCEKNHLVNLFVCHRKIGDVAITITIKGDTSMHIFKSTKPNENYHIKTFYVSNELIMKPKEALNIPITIEVDPAKLVNPELMRKMKAQNSVGESLLKQKNTDFVLTSISHKPYPVHKLVLCAHSSVLRELVKNSAKSSAFLDLSDEDMTLLIHFLYTGTVKELQHVDCMRLQVIACKFELSTLFLLAQHLICDQINIDNAVDVAILAKKYNLDELWMKVCSFIRKNPSVLATESWKGLNDVDLTKQICASLIE